MSSEKCRQEIYICETGDILISETGWVSMGKECQGLDSGAFQHLVVGVEYK